MQDLLKEPMKQITDLENASNHVQHLLTGSFRGLVFRPDLNPVKQEPLEFIQERSLLTLDELRKIVFHYEPAGPDETSRKASALLQMLAKLNQLSQLGRWIEEVFSELEMVEASRFKAPQLC